MKKIFPLLLLLFAGYLAEAQSEKEFQIRAGMGFAVYGTKSTTTISTPVGDWTNSETDGAVTFHFPLEFRYGFNKRFNAGLDFKIGSYLYEPDSGNGKSNAFIVIGPTAEYAFVSLERFRWYGGLGINYCSLVLQETEELTDDKAIWSYGGAGFKINSGVMIIFGEHFGLNFNLGWDSHNFKLKNYEFNGKDISLDNYEAKLKVGGLDFGFGATYIF